MAIQLSAGVRNAMADAYESTIGTAPKLELFTGAAPANCAAADSGTKLLSITLPSDWSAAASSGSKTILGGPWTSTGLAAGTAGHYRLKNNAGSTVHEQGTVTATGGGGDLTLDNTNIAVGQSVSVSTWTRSVGGA